ncbi:DUF2490 domain-containing protein [Archangium gephyra]|uniref:DUF2490 domain-containing protein n=1 Tax=Archangium gephyra TaxID=48 RepID=UPI0035D47038
MRPMLLPLLGVLLMLPAPSAEARPVNSEAQGWYAAIAQGPIDRPFLYSLELQPRVGQNDGRLILRSALGLALPVPGLSVWLGYAWIPVWAWSDEDPTVRLNESRLYQQLLYNTALGPVKLVSRTRLEQRLLASASGASHRVRTLLRGAYPLDAEGTFSLVLWDEVFFHLNTVEGGPRAGFDQNRAFVGAAWKLSPHVALEVGYLNNFIRRPTAPADAMIHAPYVFTVFNYL